MNTLSRALNAFLIAVLIIQLSHIRVDFAVPDWEHGHFTTLLSTPQNQLRATPLRVRLVSDEPETNSIMFVGDVLLARNVEHLMAREGYAYPYRGVDFSAMGLNPVVVGNFEAAVPEVHVPTPVRMIDFSVHERFLPSLRKAGFTHLSLANNHSFDFGQSGYDHTLAALSETDFTVFGHPRDLDTSSVTFVEIEDVTIALIAAHTLERLPSVTEIRETFSYANRRSDMQIVYVHWGSEYVLTHNPRQRDVAERFVDAGADLIVGHHPHVVQDVQLIDGVPVFYSLGNYIFDQYDSVDTQEGLVLKLDFVAEPVVALLPVTAVGTLSQPRPMEPQDHSAFLHSLAQRSDPELSEYLLRGYVPLEFPVATSPKTAMIGNTFNQESYVQ